MRKTIIFQALFQIFLVISLIFIISISSSVRVYADEVPDTSCCIKTKDSNSCQDIPNSASQQCQPGNLRENVKCEQVSECKPVLCDLNDLGYEATQGAGCLQNVAKQVCVDAGGSSLPAGSKAPQCEAGCCIVGNQATLSTESSCRSLTNKLGNGNLEVNFKSEIKNELECLNVVRQEVKGCCVIKDQIENQCNVYTLAECTSKSGEFYEGLACSSLPNSDCNKCKITSGEKINKCDSSIGDDVYEFDKCGPILQGDSVKLAQNGDCDYGSGTICREDKNKIASCQSLNCPATILWDNPYVDENRDGNYENDNESTTKFGNGDRNFRINGESWCEFDADAGPGKDLPGSRHFVYTCQDGIEEPVPCDTYRQQICRPTIDQETGFSTGTCVDNTEAILCPEFEDEESCQGFSDANCIWLKGDVEQIKNQIEDLEEDQCTKYLEEKSAKGETNAACPPSIVKEINEKINEAGKCIPLSAPGTKGEDAICSLASAKDDNAFKAFWVQNTGFDEWDCEGGCELYTNKFAYEYNSYCNTLGDCGADYNLAGKWSKNGFVRTLDFDKDVLIGDEEDDLNLDIVDVDLVVDYLKKYGNSDEATTQEAVELITDAMEKLIDPAIYTKNVSDKAQSFVDFKKYQGNLDLTITPEIKNEFSTTGALVTFVASGVVVGTFGLAVISATVGSALTSAGSVVSSVLVAIGLPAISVPVIGWVVAIAAAIIAFISGVILGGDAKEQNVNFDCKAWTPPLGGDNCKLCNEPGERTYIDKNGKTAKDWVDLTAGGRQKCDEYLCWSLGESCEPITDVEKGTLCISSTCNRGNERPVRTPLDLTKYNNLTSNCRSGIGETDQLVSCTAKDIVPDKSAGGPGYKINYVRQNTDLVVGIETSEPAECQWGFSRNKINNDFDGSGLRNIHKTKLKAGININSAETKNMFIRCRDSCISEESTDYINQPVYQIEIKTSETKNLGAPRLITFGGKPAVVPESGSFLPADLIGNKTEATLTIDDSRAICRWSKTNVGFEQMSNETERSCSNGQCNLLLTDIKEGENTFFFRCKDNDGNVNLNAIPDSNGYKLVKTKPLEISNLKCVNSLGDTCDNIYDKQFSLEVTTQGGANSESHICKYDGIEFFDTNSNTHKQIVGAKYNKITCIDKVGNKAEKELNYNLLADESPPSFLKVNLEGNNLVVQTNEIATCKFANNKTVSFDNMGNFTNTGNKIHSTSFTEKDYLNVKCEDRFNHIYSADVYKSKIGG